MKDYIHKTVLLKESIDGLNIQSNDIYLDGTLGSAGHAKYALEKYALEKMNGNLTVIGLDKDTEALERSKERLMKFTENKFEKPNSKSIKSEKIILVESGYEDLDKVLDNLNIKKVNRIMLDLGLSSDQFETSGRGFSFKKDEPLLMTFKKVNNSDNKGQELEDLNAKQIVNTWKEENIADIIYGYGEERYARRIAKAIINYRDKKIIETTGELVEIISQAVPVFYKRGRIHPATRTFQALRIAVNDELNSLKKGLEKGFERLEKDGRIAVISFHSLEDRIVKNFNKEKVEAKVAKIINKKPIIPNKEEIKENPRSRSAKLRILEKI